MELKDQVIQKYLNTGCGYRKLQATYGIGRTTICKWVLVHQGIPDLPRSKRQALVATTTANYALALKLFYSHPADFW